MLFNQSYEKLNHILINSCLQVNRDISENRNWATRSSAWKKLALNVNAGIWIRLTFNRIIEFLPRVSTWQLWLVTRERYTCPISYSTVRAREFDLHFPVADRWPDGFQHPRVESREGAAGCSLARFSAIDSAHASTHGRPNERASERSNEKHLAGWRSHILDVPTPSVPRAIIRYVLVT